MSNLNKIAQHILNKEYTQAIQKLENIKKTEKSVYWLSMLYRAQFGFEPTLEKFGYEEYLKEKDLIENVPFQNEYFSQRKKWHALPYHERSEIRPYRNERPILEYPIEQEILENMSFVAMSSNSYFEYLIELIESVQCIDAYKSVPWSIIEPCGRELTDEQKNILMIKYNIQNIRKPKWEDWLVSISKINPCQSIHEQGWCIYPYLDLLFPEYKYLFYIQPDMWVNHRYGLDVFFQKKNDMVFHNHGIILFKTGMQELANIRETIKAFFEGEENLKALNKDWSNAVLNARLEKLPWIKNNRFYLRLVLEIYEFLIDYFYKNGSHIKMVSIENSYNDNHFGNIQIIPFDDPLKNYTLVNYQHNGFFWSNNDVATYFKDKEVCYNILIFHMTCSRSLAYRKILKKEYSSIYQSRDMQTPNTLVSPEEEKHHMIWYPNRYRVLPYKEIPQIKETLRQEALKELNN